MRLFFYRISLCSFESVCVSTQSCPTLCDPMECNLSGSSVHGISRQEYWSGLPFPPPGFPTSVRSITIHSAINTKSFKSNRLQHTCHPHPSDLHTCMLQSCSTLCNPADCSPSGSSVHGISRQEYWSGVAISFSI